MNILRSAPSLAEPNARAEASLPTSPSPHLACLSKPAHSILSPTSPPHILSHFPPPASSPPLPPAAPPPPPLPPPPPPSPHRLRKCVTACGTWSSNSSITSRPGGGEEQIERGDRGGAGRWCEGWRGVRPGRGLVPATLKRATVATAQLTSLSPWRAAQPPVQTPATPLAAPSCAPSGPPTHKGHPPSPTRPPPMGHSSSTHPWAAPHPPMGLLATAMSMNTKGRLMSRSGSAGICSVCSCAAWRVGWCGVAWRGGDNGAGRP